MNLFYILILLFHQLFLQIYILSWFQPDPCLFYSFKQAQVPFLSSLESHSLCSLIVSYQSVCAVAICDALEDILVPQMVILPLKMKFLNQKCRRILLSSLNSYVPIPEPTSIASSKAPTPLQLGHFSHHMVNNRKKAGNGWKQRKTTLLFISSLYQKNKFNPTVQ